MINEILNNPAVAWAYLKYVAVIIFFVYVIIYSILQVRQVRILQDKVRTNIDIPVRILGAGYILLQVLIFIFVLIIV